MGRELVSGSTIPIGGGDRKPASFSYAEVFRAHLPYYIAIGMTPEQYWDGDCLLAKYYREADRIKLQRRHQELWLQGLYFYEALSDLAPILVAFPAKGAKPKPYPSEPYALTADERKDKNEREEKAKMEKVKSKMEAFAKKFNQKMSQQQEVNPVGQRS